MASRRYGKKIRRKRSSRRGQDELNSTLIPNRQDNASFQDNILNMQGVVGNQAVMQMMRQGDIEQPKSKANPIQLSSFKIQRMPTAEDAQALIFDSDRTDNKQRKTSVVNMLRRYHSIIENYAMDFPSVDDIRTNSNVADKYYSTHTKTLITLAKGIDANIKHLFNEANSRKSSKWGRKGKNKHQQRMDNLNELYQKNGGIKTKDYLVKAMLQEIHHKAFMARMAGASDLSFITKDDIVGDVADDAAKGGVHTLSKGQVNTTTGVKTGYFKQDEASPDDAGIGININRHEGKQSLRAVATYRISELLGMGIIPYTALTKSEDKEGNVTTGQFMEEAKGFTGRGKMLSDELPADQTEQVKSLLAELKNPDTDSERKQNIENEITTIVGMVGHKEVDGKIYKLDLVGADIDWMTPVLQKDLSTMQLFDMIVGHADRHAENYIVETNDEGGITGAKGIDNDSVWGERVTSDFLQNEGSFGYKAKMKTPGLPPVIDAEIAYRVVSTPWKGIEGVLTHYGLRAEEIQAAQDRWQYIQEGVKSMIIGNRLATMGMSEYDQVYLYLDLYSAIGEKVPDNIIEKRMMLWGEETGDLMTADNSYVGRDSSKENKVKPEDYE